MKDVDKRELILEEARRILEQVEARMVRYMCPENQVPDATPSLRKAPGSGRMMPYRFVPRDENQMIGFAMLNPEPGLQESLTKDGAQVAGMADNTLHVVIPSKWLIDARLNAHLEEKLGGRLVLCTPSGHVLRTIDENGRTITVFVPKDSVAEAE